MSTFILLSSSLILYNFKIGAYAPILDPIILPVVGVHQYTYKTKKGCDASLLPPVVGPGAISLARCDIFIKQTKKLCTI